MNRDREAAETLAAWIIFAVAAALVLAWFGQLSHVGTVARALSDWIFTLFGAALIGTICWFWFVGPLLAWARSLLMKAQSRTR